MSRHPQTRLVWALLCAVAVAVIGLSRPARADEAGAGVASFVGNQKSGLPGIGRVAVASDNALHFAAAAGAGYGYTEPVGGTGGGHHRGSGSLGFAVHPLRLLWAAILLDGRLDKHPDDVLGSSSSAVGEPRLFARAARGIGRAYAVGGEVSLWMPGRQAPSLQPGASTLDAKALFTFAPVGSDLALAFNAGYRLDRSGELVAPAERARLRSGDRISLGASDFDAVLLGIGTSKRLGKVELLGELSWDVLVGPNAPSAIESPLRAGAGARYHLRVRQGALGDAQIELRTEVGLGERPAIGPLDPFAPIEPRVSVIAGLRWVLPFTRPEKRPAAAPPKRAEPVSHPAVASGTVRGRVTAESGEPLPGARVTVTTGAGERSGEASRDGSFVFDDVASGPARIAVRADGYDDASVETNVSAGTESAIDVAMKRTIKPGQLRGLVRSFDGKPLAATIRIEPVGMETKTDADGTFQIDVPPGAYEVVVRAEGYEKQRRPVQVEENGVTVLNADLRSGPR